MDEPLAYLTVYYTRIADYISPNQASFIGVLVAALSARFIAREELQYRQFGVLLFAVRIIINNIDKILELSTQLERLVRLSVKIIITDRRFD